EHHRARWLNRLLRGDALLDTNRDRPGLGELLPAETGDVVGWRTATEREAGAAGTAGIAFDPSAEGAVAGDPRFGVGPGEQASQTRGDADREVANHEPRPPLERDRRGAFQMLGEQGQTGRL